MGVIYKLGRGKSSQEDVGWLFNHQVKATLGLSSQEFLNFLDHLNAVLHRHLEV
jgi:hypothetical protein